jgi:hypothetical protein
MYGPCDAVYPVNAGFNERSHVALLIAEAPIELVVFNGMAKSPRTRDFQSGL